MGQENATTVIVAEYENRFFIWIHDGQEVRLFGDDKWLENAVKATKTKTKVSLFDNSLCIEADIYSPRNLLGVFAAISSYPGDEVKFREFPLSLKQEVKDTIRIDFFSELLGKHLTMSEWEEFLQKATYEIDDSTRWVNDGKNLSDLLRWHIS